MPSFHNGARVVFIKSTGTNPSKSTGTNPSKCLDLFIKK